MGSSHLHIVPTDITVRGATPRRRLWALEGRRALWLDREDMSFVASYQVENVVEISIRCASRGSLRYKVGVLCRNANKRLGQRQLRLAILLLGLGQLRCSKIRHPSRPQCQRDSQDAKFIARKTLCQFASTVATAAKTSATLARLSCPHLQSRRPAWTTCPRASASGPRRTRSAPAAP